MIFTATDYEHAKARIESMTIKQLQTRLSRMTVQKKLAAFKQALRTKMRHTLVGAEPAHLQGYLFVYFNCHNKLAELTPRELGQEITNDQKPLILGTPFLQLKDVQNSVWDKPTVDFLVAGRWLPDSVELTSSYKKLTEKYVAFCKKNTNPGQVFKPVPGLATRAPRRALEL